MPIPVTPLLAADILIELVDHPQRPFVLIERGFPPYGWAVPGGFVDVGETVERAAIREAKEETGLDVTLIALLGIYSNPERDPRNHSVTAVYVAQAHGTPVAGDDAKNFGLFSFDNLPEQLAFDHAMVLADYQAYINSGRVAPLRITGKDE
ncbi:MULTISPECIES: NUDIX domain-containing protein [Methylomonas]|uniref:NUDIX domain-containing protein n=1 Tax=Methylomonas TaxID=416 RepID=UPI001232A53C|nr:NUDIX hydrolase [Methylomonas rhizoryzae]